MRRVKRGRGLVGRGLVGGMMDCLCGYVCLIMKRG